MRVTRDLHVLARAAELGQETSQILSEDFLSNPPDAGARFSERRQNPRYALIATAEITDPIGKIKLSGRTSEVSAGGCYVDVLNTLPSGTVIQIRIQRDQGAFESWGRVKYVHESIGMGVMFFQIAPEQKEVLREWIAELSSTAAPV
jgi:c-di-GMP-binding flagellar brake protein YcgR